MIEPVAMVIEDSTVLLLIDEGEDTPVAILEEKETIVITDESPQGPSGPKGDKGDQGDPGPPGATSGDLNYVHAQSPASAVWTITHPLDKFPSVTIVDSSGREVEGEIQHLSTTQVVITFETAFSGTAYLN